MPAITLDVSVVDGSNNKIHPNPIYPISTPFNLPAELVSAVNSPIDISSILSGQVGAPVVVASLDSVDLLAPVNIAEETAASIAVPIDITDQASVDISAPVDVTELAAATVSSPISITELAAVNLSNPVNITEETSATVATPSNITELAAGSIAIPVDITEQASANLIAPISIAEQAVSTVAAPVDITEIAPASLAIPTAITANALDPESPPFALNHARILYNSVLTGSATSTDNGVNPSYPLIPNTAQRWTTAVNSFIKFTMPVNNNIDTVCIGAHNLPSGGYTVQVFYRNTDGGTLISFASSMIPTDNNAIMFHRASLVSAKVIEVYITSGSGSAFIGSIYAGIAMQMQRPFFGGHTPTVLARQADYYGSMSESGNFIGVEVRRRSIESGADWKNLTDTWYRQYFVPFLTSAEILPFYFAWNLLEYPHDVAYCKNITNIAPSYSGQRDLMTVSIPLVGIA